VELFEPKLILIFRRYYKCGSRAYRRAGYHFRGDKTNLVWNKIAVSSENHKIDF